MTIFRTPTHHLLPCLFAGIVLLPLAAVGQTSTSSTPATSSSPQTQQEKAPHGTVLFERHEPEVVPETEEATPPAKPGVSSSVHTPRLRRRGEDEPAGTPVAEPVEDAAPEASSSSSLQGAGAPALPRVTEADLQAASKVPAGAREAAAVTARALDMHLNSHTGAVEVRARMSVRNGGTEPLTVVPLKISGALRWESAHMAGGAALPVDQHALRDDLDHTGVSNEAVLALPEPLAPGATLQLDLFYGGTLGESTARLLDLGAPVEVATRTDWDTVTDAFTGLRGAGNVLWYPVTGPAALLKNGSAVPKAVEAARQREAASGFSLRLTVEYDGARPDAAFLCGDRRELKPEADGLATAEWSLSKLGPRTPSLFIALGAPQAVANGLVRVVTDEADRAAALSEAAARVRPMLEEWLGPKPARVLDVIDLPIPDAAGFADGALLVAPLRTAQPGAIANSLVAPLTSAWLPEGVDAAWLRDGIPAFLQAIWTERAGGRDAALNGLAAESARLRTMEAPDAAPKQFSSSSDDDAPVDAGPQTPLATCTNPACSRDRAAYVLEMLRGMLGDSGLQGALSGWRVTQENSSTSAEGETAAFERMAQQVAGPRKLDWFFQSWVNGTGSLPQLSIVAVAPRKIERASAPANLLPQRQQPFAGPVGTEPVAPSDDPRARWGGDKEVAQAGSWLVAVEVQNTGGTEAEVPVTVRAGSLSNTLPLRVPAHGKATIRVPFEAEPDEVVVNDGTVPETGVSVHRRRIASAAPAR